MLIAPSVFTSSTFRELASYLPPGMTVISKTVISSEIFPFLRSIFCLMNAHIHQRPILIPVRSNKEQIDWREYKQTISFRFLVSQLCSTIDLISVLCDIMKNKRAQWLHSKQRFTWWSVQHTGINHGDYLIIPNGFFVGDDEEQSHFPSWRAKSFSLSWWCTAIVLQSTFPKCSITLILLSKNQLARQSARCQS